MVFKKKKIKKWDDGDSGIFADGTRFRLNRVRAPESYQYGSSRATKTAAGMTGRTKGTVSVRKVARDKFGRDLVDMKNKDGSINDRMRKKGYKNKGR
ncbi:nuclease [archaeon]|jgi:micrococcal nuclease|nr:nuclease [archaeon]MBT7128503.1 nuclease [archaeon]